MRLGIIVQGLIFLLHFSSYAVREEEYIFLESKSRHILEQQNSAYAHTCIVWYSKALSTLELKLRAPTYNFFGVCYLELTSFHPKLKLLKAWPIFKLSIVQATVKQPCSLDEWEIKGGMTLDEEAYMTNQQMIESPLAWGPQIESSSSRQFPSYHMEVG